MNDKNTLFLIITLFFYVSVSAQKYLSTDSEEIKQEWNGHQFSSHKTLKENLKNIPEMSFMNAVLAQPAVQKIFENKEMVTVFVISDKALKHMKKEEKNSFINNSSQIQNLIKNLTIPGRIDKNGLVVAVEKNGGMARIATVGQEDIQIEMQNGELVLKDNSGKTATISQFNFYHQKGLFHIIDELIFNDIK